GDRLAHVQVCANDRGAPGADHLDWPALRRALEDVGYRGPLVIESFTAEGLETVMAVWRPLADSRDALAAQGLAFLRDLLAGGPPPRAAAPPPPPRATPDGSGRARAPPGPPGTGRAGHAGGAPPPAGPHRNADRRCLLGPAAW